MKWRDERKSFAPEETTYYAYSPNGYLLWEKKIPSDDADSTIQRSYVYLETKMIGFWQEEDGKVSQYFTLCDEKGSVFAVTDAEGEIVWKTSYTAYGKQCVEEGVFDFTALYAGKEIDEYTGLTYHWNRWRNEEGDAFISEDPIRDGYNWYGYANGNPLRYVDGNGLETHVCRDGTFANSNDWSNSSMRADAFHDNGYNAGTIESMSGGSYNRWNNGGQGDRNLDELNAARKAARQAVLERSNGGKIVGIIEPVLNQEEITEIITAEMMNQPASNIPDFMTAHAPLNQSDFDIEYGFGDGKLSNTKSCKTASLVNSYASTYGLKKDDLDKAVKEWKDNNWIANDGSPKDINKMSNLLAKVMGLERHYEIPGYASKDGWCSVSINVAERIIRNVQFGILMQYSDLFETSHYVHFSSMYGKIDSLKPYRDGADTYVEKTMNPLREYKNY